MYLTLTQAAKETGKSKGTISKYLNNGKLSYVSKDEKGYQIDPAELFRIFPKETIKTPSNEQTRTLKKPVETLELETEIERLKAELTAKDDKINGLESDKVFLQGELSKTTTLLSDNREKPSQKPVQRRKRFLWVIPYRND